MKLDFAKEFSVEIDREEFFDILKTFIQDDSEFPTFQDDFMVKGIFIDDENNLKVFCEFDRDN